MNKKQSMTIIIIGLVVFLGIAAIISSVHLRENQVLDKDSLDARAVDFVAKNPIKAMVYGLWVNGNPISINAIGESMTQVPAKINMHIRIGGVTETMLTTLLMQLVDSKKISLSEPIASWFPHLPNAKIVTLQMLANGTSGYPDYVYNKKFIERSTKNPFKHWTAKELLSYAMQSKPLFSPGTNQHYSHTDYVILGEIISRIHQQPINKIFETMIFKKADMNHSVFNLTPEMPYPVLHAFSQDRNIYEDATFWDPSWTSTSGAVTSNIVDLGKWGRDFMEGNLLTQASTKKLRALNTIGKGKNNPDLYFAMGFGVANHWLVQNPSFGGYSGIFAILPEKKIVFIAYNTRKEGKDDGKNLSKTFWQSIAPNLAPDYPLPKF